MRVSLIATVLNEGDSIVALLDSIREQTRQPDEIVICDGGSTDGTVNLLYDFADVLPLQVIDLPGANISQGRNAAIAASSGDVIAVTDAGVILDPDWLAYLVAPMEQDDQVNKVAGFFLPDAHSAFEVALAATTLPAAHEIDPATFMPSSRSVAFRRSILHDVGGYPEWLDFCEDLILDFRIAALYGPFAFEPDAIVFFRPRPSLRDFYRQYYQYARGDGKANLFYRRHLIRYMTYFAVLPLLLFAGLAVSLWWFAAVLAGGAYMLYKPYQRLMQQWQGLDWRHKLSAALWVPVIRISGDFAKMHGYPFGVWWRFQNRPPEWRIETDRQAIDPSR
ncbi:MAG: glycosyltransferase [Chloroflexi bacterium]|nr:glycosyltransferase [Chloroflexota bacterium]